MNHEQLTARQVDRNDLERNTALVRAQEEDTVALARYRRRGVDGVGAVLDDMHDACNVDAVAPCRRSETYLQVTSSFCRT